MSIKPTPHTFLTSILAIALGSVITLHDIIWPCDLGAAANATATSTVSVYDSTAHRTQREAPLPVAVVYRSRPQLPIPAMDAPPMTAIPAPITAPVPMAQGRAGDDTTEAVYYYDDCLTDTATQVRACVRDSISGGRILWREWETANLRPTVTATVTEHRPDRAQVYVGPRMAALQPAGGVWEGMAGAGGRIKFKRNWALGGSYLRGLQGSQAVMMDADILIRFPGLADRRRANRAAKLAKRISNP
jgi:hypothetical protein